MHFPQEAKHSTPLCDCAPEKEHVSPLTYGEVLAQTSQEVCDQVQKRLLPPSTEAAHGG